MSDEKPKDLTTKEKANVMTYEDRGTLNAILKKQREAEGSR